MKTSSLKLICLTILLLLFSLSGRLWAQKIVQAQSPNLQETGEEPDADGNVAIFSNLGPSKTDKYDLQTYAALPVAGESVIGVPETWVAVNFIPKQDVQAQVLLAAITYISGAKLVNLGLYSDDDGKVGSPIPGAQGSTTNIPDSGECCQLARVKLPGKGVALSGGTRYWLVASPDDVKGGTFNGSWQVSNSGTAAEITPPGEWATGFGGWPAAEIRGSMLRNSLHRREITNAETKTVTIFDNLGSSPAALFYSDLGPFIAGKSAADGGEAWLGVPFSPTDDVQAKTLAAAVGYVSGDMKINLGIYSDNDGTPGNLLPNAQGSTTNIPIYPGCCDLAEVALPGSGVTLTARTRYWLVASTDDIDAPSFEGFWRETTVYSNYQEPQFFFWTFVPSGWLAAKITGTKPQ